MKQNFDKVTDLDLTVGDRIKLYVQLYEGGSGASMWRRS